MEQLTVDAKVRAKTGKKAAKKLRAAGRIPAVMYNEEGKAVSLDVDAAQFNKVWRNITSTTLVNLKVDDKEYDAFIRDTEYDIISDSVLHADFYVVTNTKEITRSFKVQYSGTPAGVLKGGFMVKHTPVVKIKCLPKDMPERFVIDVSKVNIGEVFSVKDANFGEKVKILTPPETVLISVAPAR